MLNRVELIIDVIDAQCLSSALQFYFDAQRLSSALQFYFVLFSPLWAFQLLAAGINLVLFVLQKKAKGQELVDKVCEHLNLLEKDYFACSYRETNDVKVG